MYSSPFYSWFIVIFVFTTVDFHTRNMYETRDSRRITWESYEKIRYIFGNLTTMQPFLVHVHVKYQIGYFLQNLMWYSRTDSRFEISVKNGSPSNKEKSCMSVLLESGRASDCRKNSLSHKITVHLFTLVVREKTNYHNLSIVTKYLHDDWYITVYSGFPKHFRKRIFAVRFECVPQYV